MSAYKKKDAAWISGAIKKMRIDVSTGMILANLVFYFIIVTSAHIFFDNDIYNIETAEQAALILRPVAGDFAYFLFSLGIIGTGMLAIPILAGSGAYALTAVMGWHDGFGRNFSQSKGFYLVIMASVFVGVLINLVEISPIKALYYSAFLNGIIALPLLVFIMLVGNDRAIMKGEGHPKWVFLFGWGTVVFMACAAAVTIFLSFG